MPMQSSMGFDSLFHFVLALLLGLCLPFILLHVLHAKQWKKNMIHGSMGWPFLGETLSFLKPHKSTSMGSFLQDHSSRYGKVFRSHLFGSPTVVSCDHELNAFVLQNEEKLFQCSYPKAIHGVLGKLSMIVVVGDAHKKLRSITLGLTNQWKFKDEILYDIERQVISMMESWKSRNEVVFCEEAKKFTFNVIVKQILSLRPEEPQTMKILEDFHTFMRGLISFPLYIPGSSYAKAVKARVRISSTVMKIIEKRRVDRKLGCEKGDFLDELMLSSTLNDDEKVSLALDLLLAGYETTSLLMSLSMYFLASSPLVLQQLKEEHQKISDRIKGNHLKLEDYNQMEFTQDVINEVLRCGNIVKFVHRRALKDVSFKGYFIPSGWKILPVLSSVHLDPSLHENPFEFSPWRWKDQGTLKKLACFGGGLRMCPGAELAKVETAFFLHHLVLNFRWKVQGEDHPYAHPYVEFERGLPLTIEHIKKAIRGDMCNQVVQTREMFY